MLAASRRSRKRAASSRVRRGHTPRPTCTYRRDGSRLPRPPYGAGQYGKAQYRLMQVARYAHDRLHEDAARGGRSWRALVGPDARHVHARVQRGQLRQVGAQLCQLQPQGLAVTRVSESQPRARTQRRRTRQPGRPRAAAAGPPPPPEPVAGSRPQTWRVVLAPPAPHPHPSYPARWWL
jgi:hypothetical protein